MEKILFMYLKTGGGHLAPAKAVAEKILFRKKSGVEVILHDGFDGAGSFIRAVIEGGYRKSVDKAVWIFELLYAVHKIRPVAILTSYLVSLFLVNALERKILRTRPDKIILFHFFLVKPVCRVVRRNSLDIKVITVVTDPFTAHPIWFLDKSLHFIVFSEILKEKCMKAGIAETNLKVFPFVLDSKFQGGRNNSNHAETRKILGFRPDSRIILIMGGGDGMPKGKKILDKIIAYNINAEIAIVCGNNTEMYMKAMEIRDKNKSENVRIYGYIDFVHSLISVSDIVITKCGASTFMEILLLGKIPLINNYIWEQEKGNVDYVCKGKMGIYERDTAKIPVLIDKLLSDRKMYAGIKKNIKNASLKNGVSQVSKYILEYQ